MNNKAEKNIQNKKQNLKAFRGQVDLFLVFLSLSLNFTNFVNVS